MSTIRTTIQVSFGTGATGNEHISAEVDGRTDGLNAGKTSFLPGDTAFILIYKSGNVTIDQILISAGSMINATSGTVQKEEDIFFDDASTATLSFPTTGPVAVTWLGAQLGDLVLQSDGMTVRSSAKGVAVARVQYQTTPEAKGIVAPAYLAGGIIDFSINVVIKAIVA